MWGDREDEEKGVELLRVIAGGLKEMGGDGGGKRRNGVRGK